MCGVIVVDADRSRSTCHRRDAYVQIMPRHSHYYALFYQLLDSNLFTHHNTCAILREASSETYGPRVYLLSYLLSIYLYLHLYFLRLYYKISKIYLSYHIIFIRSHFRKWPWRDWQPLYCVGCEFSVCLCRCVGLLRSLLLDWYLGSQNWGKYLRYTLLHHPLLFEENQRKLKT